MAFLLNMLYGIPEIVVDAIQDSYSETRAEVTTPDGETDEFEIFAGVLQGDTLASYLAVVGPDHLFTSLANDL